ncbi:MAG: DUF928 domain-containing protein [Cyanobacteria bacterium SID2]|nr:DUF928 domain-containing protein [Cyanobacteria bacterium SID2]
MLTSHREIAGRANRNGFRLPLIATIAIGCILTSEASSAHSMVDTARVTPRDNPSFDGASPSTRRSETDNSVLFVPPDRDEPAEGTQGGGSRGDIEFVPPDEDQPEDSAGGASRDRWQFLPPGETPSQAPLNSPTESMVAIPSDEAPSLSVMALVPETRYGLTVSPHPTFFIYLSDPSVHHVFFSLQQQNREPHYQAFFPVPREGNIVRIVLPEDAPELAIETDYQWQVVAVAGEQLRPDSPSTSGWVRRIALDAELESARAEGDSLDLAIAYGKRGIWYDTLTVLAALQRTHPTNQVLATEWRDLLSQVGLEAIAVGTPFH